MRILVTGANGYLGLGIVKQLLDDGHYVIATDFHINNIDNRAEVIASDLFSISNPFDYFKRPECLLHLAWKDGFIHNSDAHIDDLPKHYHFIKSIIKSGIKQIAVMGSMHEVGFHEGSINESTPTNPLNLYGISKDCLRKISQQLCLENNVVFQWLRGFYIVSKSKYGNSIFSKITVAEEAGVDKFPFTSGLNMYDFLDYPDFCYQVTSVINQTETNGIINICSGRPEKLSAKVEQFIYENNFKIKLEYGKFPDRKYDSKGVWGDSSKIEQVIQKRREKKI